MMGAYVGRFAPSPTGPLHFGSLVAALASYLDARHANGTWLLRIEDLDPPRESATAPDEIMQQMGKLGLTWDGDVLYQRDRLTAYHQALEHLTSMALVYPCTCSRNAIPAVYPGHCREKKFADTQHPFAIRLKLPDIDVSIVDQIFGNVNWNLPRDVGDFIVKRKDGLFAYQLAVVVDDHHQHINRIVRGADLLDSTPRQLAIYDALDFTRPEYLHVPVMVDGSGKKLSKQSHASALNTDEPEATLRAALTALGQDTQDACNSVESILNNAALAWRTELIPRQTSIPTPSNYL